MSKAFFQRTMPQSRKTDSENADDLRVIGAGLGRTGTSSLKMALEILGFGPCHHMSELFDKPDRSVQFIRALDGHKVDFHTLMKGYGSTVDGPTTEFYKEIHQAYPQAKIILTVRDSGEKWFESVQNTFAPVCTSNFYYFSVYLIRFLRLQCIVDRKLWQKWTNEFGQVGPLTHDRHNARVISENKESDILVFNVKEGWPPLCKFLGVNIPQHIPFPHVNDTQDINRALKRAQAMGLCVWTLVGLVIGVAVYFLIGLLT